MLYCNQGVDFVKKSLSLILVIALVLCFSACKSGENKHEDNVSEVKKSLEIGINDGVILPEIYEETQDEYRDRYRLGVCQRLEGNPSVVAIFIDDDESTWDLRQVNSYVNNYLKPGLRFIEEQASEWNIDLKFNLKCIGTPLGEYEIKYEGVVNKDLDVGGSTKDVLDKAANDLGYSSDWAMYSQYKHNMVNDNDVVFLTILNKKGVSYARSTIGIPNGDHVEHSVVFADYLKYNNNRASSVAFLVLNLFGAHYFDLTNIPDTFKEKYSCDIMYTTGDKLSELQITDISAFRVGWTDEIPQVLIN